MVRRWIVVAVAQWLSWSPAALACGGFFCQQVPVDQAAERIVFAIDEEERKVEVHVQISYEGEAEEFAWVVPVMAEPEIFPSVDDLFTRLSPLTMPQWNLTFEVEGECKQARFFGTADVFATDDASMEEGASGGNSVAVVQKAVVGPYDTVVLQAKDADELLDWLQDNGYDLPDELTPKLAPYVADGSYFVALRLAKGNDTGDLVPLGMRYTGVEPVVPLQLTAVAATPDMRLQPYVFASGRAVPANYMHVKINELAVDWLSGGANYPDVITAAADEAGGQAFATDFSGSTETMRGTMWAPGMYDTSAFRNATDASDVLSRMQNSGGIPVSTGTVPIISQFLEMPAQLAADGVTEVQFFSCMECWWDVSDWEIDGAALGAALEEEWIPAMQRAEELFENHGTLTRLTSSISAEEMTVDPIFVLNPDMEDVSNVHEARLVTICEKQYFFDEAPRKLVLSDGRELLLPADYANFADDFDYATYLGDVGTHAAQVVEITGRSGAPATTADNTQAIQDALDAHNAAFTAPGGCGCDSRGGAGLAALWTLGAGLLFVRRRREGSGQP